MNRERLFWSLLVLMLVLGFAAQAGAFAPVTTITVPGDGMLRAVCDGDEWHAEYNADDDVLLTCWVWVNQAADHR